MKIKCVEPIAVSLPMVKPIKRSKGEVRTADNVLVRVEADGVVGWGEAGSAPTMTGELLGGKCRERIPALRLIASGDTATDVAEAARLKTEGYVAYKIKLSSKDWRHEAERTRRICEALGASLKTVKLGGLKPLYDAALLCHELGMKVNLACKIAESGIATAAVLHLAAAIPSLEWGVSLTNPYLAEDVLVRLLVRSSLIFERI